MVKTAAEYEADGRAAEAAVQAGQYSSWFQMIQDGQGKDVPDVGGADEIILLVQNKDAYVAPEKG